MNSVTSRFVLRQLSNLRQCRSFSSLTKRTSMTRTLTCSKCCSTAAMPAPHAEGEEKVFAPKIEKIVDDIGSLTLLEVADLNELLKKRLNITDAPVMAMGAVPAAQAGASEEEEDDTPAVTEQTAFTVKLLKFDEAKKVALIKQIKASVSGMNLVQAKKFVESLPQPVKTDIPKEEADQLKEALVAAGGTAEVV